MGDVRLGQPWSAGQRVRNDLIYAAAALSLAASLHLVPRRWLATIGAALGRTACRVLPSWRRQADERLRIAFDGSPPVTSEQVFEALGADLADIVRLLDDREPVDSTMALGQGAEGTIRRAWKHGRGVVFATAHLGPIDRMAGLVASLGYPVVTLARESYDPRFTSLYERVRGRLGVRTIYRGRPGADVQLVRALRSGALVGFPMDLAGRGVATTTCRFLGEARWIPVGPARIALRTGARVLVGTPGPGEGGRVEVTVEEVGAVEEADLTERMVRALERRIRAWPAHWVWMHG
jgi:KDO2-lipid IV(A) lauroyltransferase